MLIFVLLCPILVWPLARSVRRYGFDINQFVLASLLGYLVGGSLALSAGRVAPPLLLLLLLLILPLGGILAVTAIYHFVGSGRTEDEVREKVARLEAEERDRAKVHTQLDQQYAQWICLKTYISSAQHREYLQDRSVLEANGIRFTTKQAGITNLFAHPEDAERAVVLLGLTVDEMPDP